MTQFLILHGGRPYGGRCDTELEALGRLHRFVGYSATHALEHEGWEIRSVPAHRWTEEEAAWLREQAQRLMRDHVCSLAPEDEQSRATCPACNLDGIDTADGWGWPNHIAWPRIYVQAGRAIPGGWLGPLLDELGDEDNPLYVQGLHRDIATFGLQVMPAPPL